VASGSTQADLDPLALQAALPCQDCGYAATVSTPEKALLV